MRPQKASNRFEGLKDVGARTKDPKWERGAVERDERRGAEN